MALRRSLPDCQPTGSYVSISWLLILTSMVTWPIRRLPQNFHQRYLSCNVLALIRNQCCPRRVRRDYNDKGRKRKTDPLFSKWGEVAEELECALAEGGFKSGDEHTAKDTAGYLDGKEEGAAGGSSGSGPGRGRPRQARSGHGDDAAGVDPRCEHAEEADLRAQVTRIPSDLEQGLGSGMKQQVIDQPFVL